MNDTPKVKHNYFLFALFLLALVALIYQLATSMVPDALSLLYGIQDQALEISYQTTTLMMPSIFFAISGIYCIFIMPLFKPASPFKFVGFGLGLMVIALSLFLAARFLGPVMVSSWLTGHGYANCESSTQSDIDTNESNTFVKHPSLCSANIPLSGETARSLLDKLNEGSITLNQSNEDKILEALHQLQNTTP